MLCSVIVFFFENRSIMRQCRKIWWSQREHEWRHNMAHTLCMLDMQGYMHTRVRAHARTHIQIVNRTAFPRQQWFANAPQCYVLHTLSVRLVVFKETCSVPRLCVDSSAVWIVPFVCVCVCVCVWKFANEEMWFKRWVFCFLWRCVYTAVRFHSCAVVVVRYCRWRDLRVFFLS